MSKFKTASAMMQEWEESSKRMQTEAEIRADERNRICKEQLEIMSTDGICGHDGVVTISQEAFEDIQRELCENERKKVLNDVRNVLADEIWNRPKNRDERMHNHCIRRCMALVNLMKGEQT